MLLKKINGIILNARSQGEFDKTLSVFSYELGKLRVVAKGVKRIKSHRGFHLDIFNYAQMELEQYGQNASKTSYLREISAIKLFSKIKTDPASFYAACVVSSFIEKILPEFAPQKSLFELTKKTLEALDQKEKNQKQILLTFLLKAMRLLGYMPNFVSKREMNSMLKENLENIAPQFTLNARRTFGIFSNLPRTDSN